MTSIYLPQFLSSTPLNNDAFLSFTSPVIPNSFLSFIVPISYSYKFTLFEQKKLKTIIFFILLEFKEINIREGKMADALTTTAIETLRDLLIEEVKFLSGVSDQVKQVEKDLKNMHSLLKDADKWSNRNNHARLQHWIVDLKDLALEAENVLEKYSFEVTSKREGRNLKEKLKRFICILSECFSVHQVGKEIENIRSRLTDLTQNLDSMFGREGASNSAKEDEQHMLRLTYPHEVEEHFVGMEKDIEHLISFVKDDKTHNPVISIYGMGGLGKTTLARKVYNHENLQGCFDARAWVCVTQQFEAKTILSGILKQVLHKEEIENMELHEFVVKLHNVLMQKKCLIVIDDIWEPKHWNILKPAFPANCKVVLTTRTEKIIVSQEHSVHRLDFLTEDEGWQLLKKIAILKNDAPAFENQSRSLENTGRQIVQKCGRLPLAISVIGGILRQKLAEWDDVRRNIDSYLKHGEGIGNTNIRVKQVLSLSYDALPYYLKPCFLYLGCFHEDQEIEVERLYLLWEAEGLIPSEEKGSNESLKDVARRCLTELAFRCMVQLNEKRVTFGDKIKTCRLHDLMHDRCSLKAEELEFFKRIDLCKSPSNVPPIGTSLRRLAICVDDDTDTLSINGIQKLKDLRSFLVLRKGLTDVFKQIDFQESMINFEKSKYLRVLVLVGCGFKDGKLPSQVGKLIFLRYLSLRFSNVEKLPPSVCEMPYLLTLDLQRWNFVKLHNLIWKMKNLRHLFFYYIDVIGGDELRLDGLTELETLECRQSDKICIADIPKLTNLRELTIEIKDMDRLSVIAHHMSKNQSQLRKTSLRINSCDFSSGDRDVLKNILMSHSLVKLEFHNGKISCGFPCYEQGMCENLVQLKLEPCDIEGDVMEILGKYPMLEDLILLGEAMKTKLIFGANSFPELKYLSLEHSFDLKKWEVKEKAMPKLSELKIGWCYMLEMIPDGVRFISTLQQLETAMPREFNNRLRKVDHHHLGEDYYKRMVDHHLGEDYYKVCHIPSIYLHDI